MSNFEQEIVKDVQKLESIIDPYLGKPTGDELPQVSTQDDVIVDVLQNRTGKPVEVIDVEIHHQTDPSYQ